LDRFGILLAKKGSRTLVYLYYICERNMWIGGQFYKGADLCILTFDTTSLETFNSLDIWKNAFLEYAKIEDQQTVPFVVLGINN